MALEIAAIQHDIEWENPTRTRTLLEPRVMAAAEQGARLIVLPEMWASGFTMNVEELAEAPAGPTATAMHELAAKSGAWVAGSFPERTEGTSRPTNRFLLAGPTGQDHRYSKTKPFSYGGESDHYDAGEPIDSIDLEGVRITPFICYDLRFADLFWDAAATTDLFLVPANWPAKRRQHWMTLLRARAIENQAYVCGVNRVGSGGGIDYVGDSQIIDPLGELLAEAHAGEEATLWATIDPDRVVEVRTRFPFLQDR